MDEGGNQHEGEGGNSGGHSWLAIRMVQALLTRVARRAYDKPIPLAMNAELDPASGPVWSYAIPAPGTGFSIVCIGPDNSLEVGA